MKDPKYHIYLTNEERSEILKSLIDLKNEMIVQGKYTDVLDEIIVKLYKARKKNIKVIYIYIKLLSRLFLNWSRRLFCVYSTFFKKMVHHNFLWDGERTEGIER